jgi:glycine dehydrogenase subunit 1
MRALAGRNIDAQDHPSFLGGGAYRHYRPATVDYALQRGELYTSYTPYQPEISQGMLQAMFEYQTMVCQLTSMEVSNASHYDGATSLAEAVLLSLAAASRRRSKIVMSPAVHAQFRQVVKTYLTGTAASVV